VPAGVVGLAVDATRFLDRSVKWLRSHAVAGLSFDPIAEARRQWEAHGWGEFADGMAALTAVMRVQQLLLARCDEVLADFDLTFARYELLALLSFTRHGELPLGKAGARLQVHPASVTNAVNRLESAGLVEKLPHPTDGRGTLARITPPGRDAVAAATERLNNRVFGALGISAEEAQELTALLAMVRTASGD
jgi:DNA-binding MarR family transcriptional regulator